jgi:hypothetical protein
LERKRKGFASLGERERKGTSQHSTESEEMKFKFNYTEQRSFTYIYAHVFNLLMEQQLSMAEDDGKLTIKTVTHTHKVTTQTHHKMGKER